MTRNRCRLTSKDFFRQGGILRNDTFEGKPRYRIGCADGLRVGAIDFVAAIVLHSGADVKSFDSMWCE